MVHKMSDKIHELRSVGQPTKWSSIADMVDWKIGIGSILSTVVMIFLFGIGVYSNVLTGNLTSTIDKKTVTDNQASIVSKLDVIITEQDRVKLALPAAARDVLDAQIRITELEKRMEDGRKARLVAEAEQTARQAADETSLALVKQRVEDLYNATHVPMLLPTRQQK